MQRILVIGPSWVGDMMMAQSLLQLLKIRSPDCELHVLAPSWSHGLLGRMPQVDQALQAPFQHGGFDWQLRRKLGRQLREQNYQQAIVLPNSWKSALLPFWAGIPKRTGWVGEMRYGLLNDIRRLDKKRYPLMAMRYTVLALAKNAAITQLPRPKLIVNAKQVEQALTALSLVRPQKPLLALCPGAEFGSSKRWPTTYFTEVAKQKQAEGYQIWLFGSAKDQVITQQIVAELPDVVDLAGRTNLEQAIDLLSLSDQVLTNDSGLMHISAALGKPLVAIYGSTGPGFTPPLSDRAHSLMLKQLDCRPCGKRECPLQHHRCMRDITPNQVIAALNEV